MRCLALFTGGLDSQIAVRMMQRQGLEVVGFYVQTPFTVDAAAAKAAAEKLQIPLVVESWQQDYLTIVRRPRFGHAAGMAPCLDCRVGMLARAKAKMELLGTSFLISGDVIGQRSSSLRSRDLETMAVHGGVDDLLLRPLSAKLLPITLPERSGWVDRELLHGWQGRGRKEQLRLAREWNLEERPDHAPGCLLLQEAYAQRLKQLLDIVREPPAWELQTLALGRHFTLRGSIHLVIARNAMEGERLKLIWQSAGDAPAVFMEPANFRGPSAVICGLVDDQLLQVAAKVVTQQSKDVTMQTPIAKLFGCPWAETLLITGTETSGSAIAWK
jgi:tRNA-uridine 2-sulfurtransferase